MSAGQVPPGGSRGESFPSLFLPPGATDISWLVALPSSSKPPVQRLVSVITLLSSLSPPPPFYRDTWGYIGPTQMTQDNFCILRSLLPKKVAVTGSKSQNLDIFGGHYLAYYRCCWHEVHKSMYSQWDGCVWREEHQIKVKKVKGVSTGRRNLKKMQKRVWPGRGEQERAAVREAESNRKQGVVIELQVKLGKPSGGSWASSPSMEYRDRKPVAEDSSNGQ